MVELCKINKESSNMHNYLQIFISLFAITNPIIALTIYLNVTNTLNREQKKVVITICGITVFIILNLCLYIGKTVLELLDIHPYALQLGGGIIILLIGITTILKHEEKKDKETAAYESVDHNRLISMGVSPLALPMVVGPGGIAMVILFGQAAPNFGSKLMITAIIAIIAVIVVIVFSLADVISKIMGELGIIVLNKIIGLLLTAIAFEMIIGGLKEALPIISGGASG